MQKQRQVVIIPLSSPLFEEAVFFLRKNTDAEEGSIIREAEKIAFSCLNGVTAPPYLYQEKKNKKKALWLSLGIAATIAFATFIYMVIK